VCRTIGQQVMGRYLIARCDGARAKYQRFAVRLHHAAHRAIELTTGVRGESEPSLHGEIGVQFAIGNAHQRQQDYCQQK